MTWPAFVRDYPFGAGLLGSNVVFMGWSIAVGTTGEYIIGALLSAVWTGYYLRNLVEQSGTTTSRQADKQQETA